MSYKEVCALINFDAAYIAGLIDGEGTVTLCRRHVRDRRQLVVSIANTERDLLAFVLDRVGAGKITSKRAVANHHTPSFVYSVSNRQALALLEQVGPYLRSHKAERARLALSRYTAVVPRNGKYDARREVLRNQFEAEFFAITPRRRACGGFMTEAGPEEEVL